MELFEENSPEDLACRGFGQAEILDLTGVDTGYHTNALRSMTQGIDRMAYKAEHVRMRISPDTVSSVLDQYALTELDCVGVLSVLGLANPNVCKLKKLFALLGMADEFAIADKAQRKTSMRRGMKSKYGVDNPFKLESFQEKAADTREQKYGAKYTLCNESSLSEGARETFREHMKDDEFRADVNAKKRATCMEHFGVEHPMQDESVKVKSKSTLIAHYGVNHPTETPAYVEGMRRFRSDGDRIDAANEKRRQTNMDRYGVEYWVQTEEARVCQSAYMLEDLEARFSKMHETMQAKYGVDWGGQTDAHHEAMHRVWQDRGHEIVNAIRMTNMERYGVPYWSQTDAARKAQSERMLEDGRRRAELARDTMRSRYGVDHWMHVPDHVKAMQGQIIERGLFGTSFAELDLLCLLCETFGIDDVDWQHVSDERYPFACDFHIKSRDLFIEFNGTWTHGGHWYDCLSQEDARTVDTWQRKHTKYYVNAICNWTDRDVRKRDAARNAGLNYVVFWDGSQSMADARLWFAMGCPDGRDWECEHSWLPDRSLDLSSPAPELADTSRNAAKIARWANSDVIYARELAMWEENAYQKQWGTLQAQLYANRYKHMGRELYAGKLPDELTDREIIRGLGIMGKLRAYTTFDATAMRDVVERHQVKSVLDPCAGWGERMVTCIQMDVDYFGIDVNEKLEPGYERIVSEYGDASRHKLSIGDSSTVEVDDMFDAVITCPPYGNIEIYTDIGAENLDDVGFASWWDDVVANMTPHVNQLFCVQTNQACKQVFADGLARHGWVLSESIELPKRSSHMTRGKGGIDRKREYEEMLVFRR